MRRRRRSTSALSASAHCWACARAMRLSWRPASSFSNAGGRAHCSRSTFGCCELSSRPQPPRLLHSPLHLHLHLHRMPRRHQHWTPRTRALELSACSRQRSRRPPAFSSAGGRSRFSARMCSGGSTSCSRARRLLHVCPCLWLTDDSTIRIRESGCDQWALTVAGERYARLQRELNESGWISVRGLESHLLHERMYLEQQAPTARARRASSDDARRDAVWRPWLASPLSDESRPAGPGSGIRADVRAAGFEQYVGSKSSVKQRIAAFTFKPRARKPRDLQ